MRFVVALALALLAAGSLQAQERDIREANLPREYERRLLRLFGSDSTTRYDGRARVQRGSTLSGDVAATGGPLVVDGRVEGDVAMIGGDVVIRPSGGVSGDVVVVGGRARLEEGATVGGDIVEFGGRDLERRYADGPDDGEEVADATDQDAPAARGPGDRSRDERRGGELREGDARLTLSAGPSYNRVEGLAVMGGPVIETRGPRSLRLEALGIWRTAAESPLGTDPWGYRVKATQFLDESRILRVGGSAFSTVDPINGWHLRDTEASIAALGFHQDLRDHFGREGWSASVGIRPTPSLDLEVGYRDEGFRSLGAADPWTLFNRAHGWRAQPLVGEGELRSVIGSVELDLRDDREDPFEGWYGRAELRRGVGGDLVRPELVALTPEPGDVPAGMPLSEDVPAQSFSTDFTAAFVDFRRYMPVTSESQLNLRVVGGGNVEEAPLPPQFQHALGGPGTLPGYSPFLADCGARVGVGSRDGSAFYPGFGCDRFLLGQVEFRGQFTIDLGFHGRDRDRTAGDGEDGHDRDDDWWHRDIEFSPRWMVFMDAGQGWSYDDTAPGERLTTGRLYDAGAGFLLDDVGVYFAVPLNEGVDREARFFVRLQRRF